MKGKEWRCKFNSSKNKPILKDLIMERKLKNSKIYLTKM
jgi:hypothetical protein